MKKVLLSALLACSIAVTTTGCFGSYGFTKTIKGIGDGIGPEPVKAIVFFFLGMPVGVFCLFADWVLFNPLEYWLGAKVFAAGDTYRETDESGNSVTAVKMEDGSLYMRLDAVTGEKREFVLQKDEETIRILDTKGNLLKEMAYAE